MFAPFWPRRTNRESRAGRGNPGSRPQLRLESIEDRLCPSGGVLVVGSFANNGVFRYGEDTGTIIDRLDRHNLGDLKNPVGGVFGPDGNFYVSSGVFGGSRPAVLQYDGTTGAFLRVFASQNLTSPRGILFGPDGNLYVANGNDDTSGDPASVERFDGTTGAFLDYFVDPRSNGGLTHPSYMVFGPDGREDGKLDLYVGAAAEREGSSPHMGEILRYDGTTGDPLGVFVPPNSGGLNSPQGMLFGPDGNLYVASGNWWASPEVFYKGAYPAGAILKFQGPSGTSPGAFQETFIAGGSGGLANPAGMVFGPDASGDGRPDLYVANCALKDGVVPIAGTSGVLRYDAATGEFLGTFVAPGSEGIKFPTFLTFTETDPATLNYTAGGRLSAATVAARPATAGLRARSARPLLGEAIRRWNQTGLTVKERTLLRQVRFRVADVDGLTLGGAAGTTITLDQNAARWAWLVDRTPRSDREFARPGNQGEQGRMDLLTVLMHKVGHLLAHGHSEGQVTAETLRPGERSTLGGVFVGDPGTLTAPPGAGETIDPITCRRTAW